MRTSLELDIALEKDLVVDFAALAESKYGFETVHPNLITADDLLGDDDDDDDDDEEEDGDAAPGNDQPKKDGNDNIDGANESVGEAGLNPGEGAEPKKPKKKAPVVGRYDLKDPFIDDTEMQWEENAAAAEDGFFVFSGEFEPPEIQPPANEKEAKKASKRKNKADGASNAKRQRKTGNANANGAEIDGTATPQPTESRTNPGLESHAESPSPAEKAAGDAQPLAAASAQAASGASQNTSNNGTTKQNNGEGGPSKPKKPRGPRVKKNDSGDSAAKNETGADGKTKDEKTSKPRKVKSKPQIPANGANAHGSNQVALPTGTNVDASTAAIAEARPSESGVNNTSNAPTLKEKQILPKPKVLSSAPDGQVPLKPKAASKPKPKPKPTLPKPETPTAPLDTAVKATGDSGASTTSKSTTSSEPTRLLGPSEVHLPATNSSTGP